MPDEWKKAKLGSLLDVQHGFAFKGEYFRDEPPGDILLTPGNFAIGGGFKHDKFKYYDGPVPEEFVLQEGDLLVTMTDLSRNADTLGYPALVPRASGQQRHLHNQRLGKILIKDARNNGQTHVAVANQGIRDVYPTLRSAAGHRLHPGSVGRQHRTKPANEPDAGGDCESDLQVVVRGFRSRPRQLRRRRRRHAKADR